MDRTFVYFVRTAFAVIIALGRFWIYGIKLFPLPMRSGWYPRFIGFCNILHFCLYSGWRMQNAVCHHRRFCSIMESGSSFVFGARLNKSLTDAFHSECYFKVSVKFVRVSCPSWLLSSSRSKNICFYVSHHTIGLMSSLLARRLQILLSLQLSLESTAVD